MKPARKDVYRAAVAIITGIRHKLIVDSEVNIFDHFRIIIDLHDSLESVMRQFSVTDEYPQSASEKITVR